VPKQYYEESELAIEESDDQEEIADKMTMMDDSELMQFGFWLDDLNMAYEQEMSLRFHRSEGH
jgi:hypothetical protein